MNQIPDAPKPRALRVIVVTIGRAVVTAIHVLGATIKAASSGGNGPVMPPSTKPIPDRQDYRP
jgi:hypothetical protein